jgi:glutathione S-transferase
MKLYYTPGACSLAVHIALREAMLPFELEKVDLDTKKTEEGRNFLEINPKGYVPALELDDRQILTEMCVCLQYVADRVPDKHLAPRAGTIARYRLMEWLSYISSEVHKQFAPLFHLESDAQRDNHIKTLNKRFGFLAQSLHGRQYLMDSGFTVADAYLYTMLAWTQFLKINIAPWPELTDILARVAQRRAVQETRKAEGLA